MTSNNDYQTEKKEEWRLEAAGAVERLMGVGAAAEDEDEDAAWDALMERGAEIFGDPSEKGKAEAEMEISRILAQKSEEICVPAQHLLSSLTPGVFAEVAAGVVFPWNHYPAHVRALAQEVVQRYAAAIAAVGAVRTAFAESAAAAEEHLARMNGEEKTVTAGRNSNVEATKVAKDAARDATRALNAAAQSAFQYHNAVANLGKRDGREG